MRLNLFNRIEAPNSCPEFVGRAASGFRPKFHNRAESLRLESLKISRAVVRDSLNIPKMGRKSLGMSH